MKVNNAYTFKSTLRKSIFLTKARRRGTKSRIADLKWLSFTLNEDFNLENSSFEDVFIIKYTVYAVIQSHLASHITWYQLEYNFLA